MSMIIKAGLSVIFIFAFLTAAGCTTVPDKEIPVSPDRVTGLSPSTDTETIDESAYLSTIKSAWRRFSGVDNESANWRKFRYGYLRTEFMNRGLIAYWEIHSRFPGATDMNSTIEILEKEGLVPFWPIDPESRERVRIVNSADEIDSYSEVYPISVGSGTWNFMVQQYQGSPPFDPYIGEVKSAQGLIYVPKSYPGGTADETDFIISNLPEDVYVRFMSAWFSYLIKDAFTDKGGMVPTSVEELLGNRVIFNEKSRQHPGGLIASGAPGDFEFGVDPMMNAYYMIYHTSNQGRVEIAFKFVKTKIGGEFVYNVGDPNSMISQANMSELTGRIPLLTDEMFSDRSGKFGSSSSSEVHKTSH